MRESLRNVPVPSSPRGTGTGHGPLVLLPFEGILALCCPLIRAVVGRGCILCPSIQLWSVIGGHASNRDPLHDVSRHPFRPAVVHPRPARGVVGELETNVPFESTMRA